MYSINILKTVADCDALLEIAGKEKGDLEYRKLVLTRRQTSSSESYADLDAEEQLVTAEIAALTSVIASLPDGETKSSNQSKLKKQEYKQYLLSEKKTTKGAVSLLDIEFDLARIEAELTVTEAFIVAVESRKTELV